MKYLSAESYGGGRLSLMGGEGSVTRFSGEPREIFVMTLRLELHGRRNKVGPRYKYSSVCSAQE